MSELKLKWNEYDVGDGIGCWLKCSEIVKEGTVRFLAGKLMYAYKVYPKGFFNGYGTWWVPVDKNDYDEMRKWKANLL